MIVPDAMLLGVIACCACAARPAAAEAAAEDGDEADNADVRAVRDQLDDRVRALFGRSRSGGGGGGWNGTRAGPKLTVGSLFSRNGVDRSWGRRRATTLARPKNAEDGGGGGGTAAAEGSGASAAEGSGASAAEGSGASAAGGGTGTATTAADDRREKFATESECASANGRPCACLVADFLARLRRTDDDWAAAEETAVAEYACPSYVSAPKAFVVSSSGGAAAAAAARIAPGAERGNGTKEEGARKPVDFDRVVHYELDRSGKDHYAVHYGLVSNDLKIRCLRHLPVDNGTNTSNFKWDTTAEHKSNSTITGSNTNTLIILGLDSKDTKNYTCVVSTIDANEKAVEISYKHQIIAVERPVYEIRGTVVYQASNGGCKNKTIDPVRNQLPGLVLSELCPDGSSGYVCNVVIETFNCNENKSTLEISYLITLNDNLNAIIRSIKKSHNALHYQKMMASVSGIFAMNLYTMLTIPIVSKYSLFNTHFKPDNDWAKIESFVACPPGFGIREIFCGACPPHYYNPNISADCLKCPKSFHQPVAGSDSCVKCPSIFADGCSVLPPMKKSPTFFYYAVITICLSVLIIFIVSCAFCCREEGENKDIKVIPRQIRKKFKRKKGYKTLKETYDSAKTTSTSNATDTAVEEVPKTKNNENPKQKVKISEPVTTLTYKKLAED